MALVSHSSDMILYGGLLLGGLVALFIVILVVRDFVQELHYINMEIQRTTGEERMHWIKRRRKLWLSLLPFHKK